jgi:hypothetical protein
MGIEELLVYAIQDSDTAFAFYCIVTVGIDRGAFIK